MCARIEAIGAMTQKSQMAAEGLGTGQPIFFCIPVKGSLSFVQLGDHLSVYRRDG